MMRHHFGELPKEARSYNKLLLSFIKYVDEPLNTDVFETVSYIDYNMLKTYLDDFRKELNDNDKLEKCINFLIIGTQF